MPVKARAKREMLLLRLTASEKALYQEAQASSGYSGSADIYRSLLGGISELTLKLRDGEITPEQFQSMAGVIVANVIVPGVQEQKEKKDDG